MVKLSIAVNPPAALILQVYLELLWEAVMVRSSTNSCTDVPCLTTLLDSSNHWMDCTGTGVEQVMLDLSPSWKALFPVTVMPCDINVYLKACMYVGV